MYTEFNNAAAACPKCGWQLACDSLGEEEGFDAGSYRLWCLNNDYSAFFGPTGEELETNVED